MPRMPPLREITPTMPAIMNVNSMMVAWSKSATALATYTSKLANSPVNTPLAVRPSSAQAPSHKPSIKAGNTLRMRSAIPIATSGGSIETHAGITGTSACSTTSPSNSRPTTAVPVPVAVTSLNTHSPSARLGMYGKSLTRSKGVGCEVVVRSVAGDVTVRS